MGDARFKRRYDDLAGKEDLSETIHALPDEAVIEALAGASTAEPGADPYLANVLATEALNRLARARRIDVGDEGFQALFEAGRDATFLLDVAGFVLSLNRAAERLTGYTAEQVVGAQFLDYVAPEEREHIGARFLAVQQGEEPQEDVVTMLRPDGSPLRLWVAGVPMRRGGEVVAIFGIATPA